jgi:hypothetical protein
MKWGLLKHIDRWNKEEHLLIPEMIEIYKGTPVKKIPLFKEKLGISLTSLKQKLKP